MPRVARLLLLVLSLVLLLPTVASAQTPPTPITPSPPNIAPPNPMPPIRPCGSTTDCWWPTQGIVQLERLEAAVAVREGVLETHYVLRLTNLAYAPLPVPVPMPREPQPRPQIEPAPLMGPQAPSILPRPVPAEARVVIPVPAGSAVTDLALTGGPESLEGRILGADEAKRIYEEIVRRQIDPALLRSLSDTLYEVRAFPIPAGEQRQVRFTVTTPLLRDGDLSAIEIPWSRMSPRPNSASVDVRVDLPREVRSALAPGFELDVQRRGAGRLDIHWASRAGWTPTANFRLQLGGGEGLLDTRLLAYRPDGEDGTFALLFAPALTTERAVSRDVILVLDTSGSMAGTKMQQAQAAATYVLEHLSAGDRFAVVSFGQTVRTYGGGLSAVSERAAAVEHVRSLVAAGGTNISGALERALALTTSDRPATVIFLTDGLPTAGVTDRDGILAIADRAARQRVQLFSFGLGSDVETVLLDALAQRFVGSSHYVAPEERVDSAVQLLFERISTPVLTDVQISISGGDTYDLAPATLPGFFAGSQALLTGRYRAAGDATVTVRGNTPEGPRTFTYRVTFPPRDGADPAIALIWAQRRIADLLTTLRIEGQQPQLVQQIVKIATRFGIVTPYTSYLAQEPKLALRPQDAANRVAQSAAAAPSTGASAVAGATDLGKLREGSSGAQAQQPVRTLGAHAYFLIDGTWVRDGFEPGTAAAEVRVGSREFADLLAADPEIASAAALGERVVIGTGAGWRTLVWPAAEGSTSITLPVLRSAGPSAPRTSLPVVIEASVLAASSAGTRAAEATATGPDGATSNELTSTSPARAVTPDAGSSSAAADVDGGAGGWLMAAGIAIAASLVGAGAAVWRRRHRPATSRDGHPVSPGAGVASGDDQRNDGRDRAS